MSADSLSRIVAAALSDSLGVPVIVDAKPGAGGNTASEFVSRVTPDGYTIILLTGWSRRFRGALQEAALPSGRQLRFHFSGRHLSVRGGDTRRRSDREPCRLDRNGASAARQAVVQLRRLRIDPA